MNCWILYTNYMANESLQTCILDRIQVSVIGRPKHASSTSSVSSDAVQVSSDHEGH
ncbi:hypothetical protein PILCRDRAFT_819554 [Piloderma croceum F 1598]|uniref:Uncharacterized protein n=1 Tax=Piloderma croceum (strain F 1598) TaxID=765440 RepID=A0A0C3C145_PILCF|nr:hypothetical protein PILCRDRAFT_819554 [Piloderma croceum F 1598]